MTGSLRAYSRHRAEKGFEGQSLAAVQKAIESGRIAKEADGSVDFEKADASWAARTSPSSSNRTTRHRSAGPAAPGVDRKPATAQPAKVNFHVDGELVDFNTARTATEIARAALLNLELQEQQGLLVEFAALDSFVSEMIIRARDEFLRIGPELRDRLAQEVDPIRCDEMITKRVRHALAGMKQFEIPE